MRKGEVHLEPMMRWFGPSDPVPLSALVQAGCSGVVTAMHEFPPGEVWLPEAIRVRKQQVEAAGLSWTVVESLPVHEEIKTGSGSADRYIENYRQNLRNLARVGIRVVTYNFMPVLDWLRTDVAYPLPTGAETLRFQRLAYVAFDLFLLKRPDAEKDYSEAEQKAASVFLEALSPLEREALFQSLLMALPGSNESFTPKEILDCLSPYACIDREQLKENLYHFLNEVAPVAEAEGIRLAIHPDDPPYPVLGLPRIMSTAEDVKDLFEAVPNPANGLCFCSGSFGARPDNDLIGMVKDWGSRIYFLHLRNTKRNEQGDFMEAPHLAGDTDMVGMMVELVRLMRRERRSIPMRPDHGFKMLDDLQKETYPGYSAIGRLKGLAELTGLEMGVDYLLNPPSQSH